MADKEREPWYMRGAEVAEMLGEVWFVHEIIFENDERKNAPYLSEQLWAIGQEIGLRPESEDRP